MSFTFMEFPPTTVVETKTPTPREEKVNPAFAGLTTFADIPQPHTLPRNYKAYATEGFENDTAFKVISYITQNAGAIPPVLYTDRTKQKKIDSHPLLDKLDQPNNEQTGVEYIEGALGYLLIDGNSYQYSIRKGKQGPPDELWALEPPKVKPIPSRQRGIVGYEYDDFDAKQNPIDPANIGRLRFWNPADPLFGFSPMQVAAILIDQQSAAKKWNLAQLQNFGKPSGAWTAPTVLSPNDYSKTLEKLREMYAGYQNAGKTQLLDGGMAWQPTGMSPTDMDWLNAMKYNAGGIANIFNIAPQLIGDTSSTTYDNMDQAKAASYTEAIFPLLDKFYALLRNWLLPMYPDLKGAYLYYDKKTVEVVQAIIQAKNSAIIDQATKIFLAGGCDLFTYQQMVGDLVGVKPDPNGKGIYRVGMILVSSDKLSDYADQAMTMPANPPKPIPEPVSDNLPPSNAPGGQPSNTTQQGNTNNATGGTTPPPTDSNTGTPNKPNKPARAGTANTPASQASGQAGGGKVSALPHAARDASHHESHLAANGARLEQKAGSGEVNYLLWECGTHPCADCAQNDNVLIAVGDSFPNGCDEPECHRNCQCTLHELSVPDDMGTSDLAGLTSLAIIAAYAVSKIAGSHAGEPNQQDVEDEEDDDEEDDTKHIHDLAAARERKQRRLSRREEYRAFMQGVL